MNKRKEKPPALTQEEKDARDRLELGKPVREVIRDFLSAPASPCRCKNCQKEGSNDGAPL